MDRCYSVIFNAIFAKSLTWRGERFGIGFARFRTPNVRKRTFIWIGQIYNLL